MVCANELACKPDSVPRRRELSRRRGGDHPSGHTVAGCLKRPTRRLGRAALGRLRCRTPLRHSWPCFGWGLPSHSGHPECWCALTAPFHPYHREVAVCFLWHCPASHLGLPLAITPLCEVRTFLVSPPALSPIRPASDPRPPGQLVRNINVLLRVAIPRAGHT